MYEVTEYIIQEVEVDEDGDVEDWGDVWDFSEFKIEVKDEKYNTVATFGSFREAEKFVNDSDEELKIIF